MTTLAGRTIAALRSEHEALASAVLALTTEQLRGPSGAAEWTIADVLSHLGSGAEITLASFRASVGEAETPASGFNESVWDRWNALSPAEQATGWLESDEALIIALEEIAPERYDDIAVKLGFLPEPIPLASFAAMRFSEVVQHAWDVQVGIDAAAVITEPSATLLAEHFSGGISFLLGFLGKTDALTKPVVLEISNTQYRLVLDGGTRLTTDNVPATATFGGETEAVVRLLGGRLKPQYTPADLKVTGNVTLDELRTVFPGF